MSFHQPPSPLDQMTDLEVVPAEYVKAFEQRITAAREKRKPLDEKHRRQDDEEQERIRKVRLF